MKYKLQLWPFAMALVCLSAYPAAGAFVFNITQQGLNVSVVGAGTLDTSALTPGNSGSGNQPGIQPAQAFLDAGPMSITSPIRLYSNGISGPSNFGSGEFRYQASTGIGDVVGIAGSTLVLPSGYISNSTLSDSNLFPDETISYIGLSLGTYVYNWGSGATADSLTINIGTVPEPASLALLGVPAAIALLRRRRGVV
jgi:hypothetical protein